jgi:hypothetical protein
MSDSVAGSRDPGGVIATVVAKDPAYTAEAGWSHAVRGYWFAIYDADGVTLEHGGVDTNYPLLSLYDLVAASLGYIDWSQESDTLRVLRDAPWREQANEKDGTPASDVLRRALGNVA